jgi:hypothetical protein
METITLRLNNKDFIVKCTEIDIILLFKDYINQINDLRLINYLYENDKISKEEYEKIKSTIGEFVDY